MKSVRSRRDVDELAFASLGLPSHTGTMTSGYMSDNGGHMMAGAMDSPGMMTRPMLQQPHPVQYNLHNSQAPVHYNAQRQAHQTYQHNISDNMETEIM